jgi:hypothetical protein
MKQTKLLAAVGFAGLLFAQTSARADVVFDFATLGPDSPPALGTTQTFTAGGISITAAGFNYAESGGIEGGMATYTPSALFNKNESIDERGLGLANDPRGDFEISGLTVGLIRIQLPTGLPAGFSFQMNSTTNGEGWEVFGSNSATPLLSFLTPLAGGAGMGTDELNHNLNTNFVFYFFIYDPSTLNAPADTNVLLRDVDLSVIPLPGALPLVATGLAGLGLLGCRRKRKAYKVP